MVTALLNQINLEWTIEKLQKASDEEHIAATQELSASLAISIIDGTVTTEEVDSFLKQAPGVDTEVTRYLLTKKAWLLLRQGLGDEALKYYDDALDINEESPSTWAAKGAALLELSRLDEAFHAFQEAYFLRENFGSQKEGYLRDLFQGWSISALFRGLFGILNNDTSELQKGVEAYLEVLENSRKEGIPGSMGVLEAKEPVSKELKEALEELEVAVRLTSIKDPFERFRELSKEISKVWPEGVSAVDAIREQRDS